MRVLYFGAEFCSQCKMWKPKVEALCKELDVPFNYNDVEENPSWSALYGFRNIPFVILEDETGDRIASGPAADVYKELEKYKEK